MRYALALAVPGFLFAKWMWSRWHDLTDYVPVTAKWQAEDNRRRMALGAEGICWNWPVKK